MALLRKLPVRGAVITAALLLPSPVSAPPGPSSSELALSPAAAGSQGASTERAVKAELLARLPLFVTWPEEGLPAGSDPLVIGILGLDPLGDEIDRSTEEREVSGHPLQVIRFEELRDLGGRLPPHVLFVSASEHEEYDRILRALAPDPVLLVGEEADFLRAGGHVTVGIRESRAEVVIALDRLQTRGFRVDSRLVELARVFEPPR